MVLFVLMAFSLSSWMKIDLSNRTIAPKRVTPLPLQAVLTIVEILGPIILLGKKGVGEKLKGWIEVDGILTLQTLGQAEHRGLKGLKVKHPLADEFPFP